MSHRTSSTPASSSRRPLSIVGAAVAASAVAVLGFAAPASAETEVAAPATFTSAFTSMATPDQVVNSDSVVTPGTAGATGSFMYRVNSDLEIICYDITLTGLSGEYQSPAKTATHIHQAAVGKAGPPRIAFPNPAPVGDGPRTSSGCLQGPFTTGVIVNGADTGTGFSLKTLEADAAAFATDSHTVANPAGAVRGQLTSVPVGGIQTGGGGTAAGADSGSTAAVAGFAALTLAGAAGVIAYRRRAASRV